jgi:sugar-specific transcriptional regulator TrmB
MALPFLQTLGLTQKEAELYELLLKRGELNGADIIKESGLKRATVYVSLYALEQKGLITKKDIRKKIHFKPESPNKLLELADKALTDYERARGDLQGILPEMISSYLLSVERPVVSTFEGVKGLKEVYNDTLRENKPIYAVLTTAEVDPAIFTWLTDTYTKLRAKAEIPAKVIVASGEWSSQYVKRDEAELRETRLVPKDKFPVQHEVDIYGDKVAFINYKKGEALIAVVINHPQIAQTMKAWFDLAWIGATQLAR